jgi:PTS system mannose-specific IIA component
MLGILIISHGNLPEALISSAQILVGYLQKVKGVSIWPHDGKAEIQERIQKDLADVDDGDGVIILTDLLGGTPTNLSLSFLHRENVQVVTGVNIPMLLALASYRQKKSLEEIGPLVKKAGRRSITLFKNIGRSEKREKWKKWYSRLREKGLAGRKRISPAQE